MPDGALISPIIWIWTSERNGEWTAIPDILLAEHFLKERDADLPGDSKNILTAAYFDFE